MPTFKDSVGREWSINLTIAAVRRVKDKTGIDLCAIEAGDPPLGKRLTEDAPLVFSVLTELTADARKAVGLTAEQFEAGFTGKEIGPALSAFWDELLGFFLPWRPTAARAMLTLLGVPITPVSGPSSTGSPASSESTPAPSPSASS
jgi:hypothetical protein